VELKITKELQLRARLHGACKTGVPRVGRRIDRLSQDELVFGESMLSLDEIASITSQLAVEAGATVRGTVPAWAVSGSGSGSGSGYGSGYGSGSGSGDGDGDGYGDGYGDGSGSGSEID
jgi:hypothetical protein